MVKCSKALKMFNSNLPWAPFWLPSSDDHSCPSGLTNIRYSVSNHEIRGHGTLFFAFLATRSSLLPGPFADKF